MTATVRMSRAGWLTRRALSQAVHSRIVAFVVGVGATAALEEWVHSDWKSALYAATALILLAAIYFGWRLFQEDRSSARGAASARETMRPDPEAELLALSSHEARIVVGKVIELFTRPNLTGEATLDEKGWSPSEVIFKKTDEKRNFRQTLDQIGGLDRSLRSPNRKKFGIAKYSTITHDSDRQPEFTFYETDYFTQMSVFRVLPGNSQLRSKFGSLEPANNRVPNAMSLQSIVLFPNHEILCMLRRQGVDGEEERWSISFEEQLKDVDFEQMPTVSPPEFLFRRAFVEEVFGCKSDSIVHIRNGWQDLDRAQVLRSYRLWGLFYEVPAAHFQLLGFYWLNATPEELASYHSHAKLHGWAGTDPEGKLFVLERQEWERLLGSGYGRASGLYHASKQEVVRVEELHRTSLYRLWRLANLLGYNTPSAFSRHLTVLNLAANP